MSGIAGLHVGPVDLGLGLGLGLDRDAPSFWEALRAIVEGGRGAGVTLTMHAVAAGDAARWLELGFDELVLSADIQLLQAAFEVGVRALRGDASAPGIGPYGRREDTGSGGAGSVD